MSSTSFVIERTYNAPLEKVWNALTEKDEMKQWYFALDDFKPEVGFEFSFAGQGRKGEKYIHRCKITEVVKHKKLAYSWTYENNPGYSEVLFELFDEGGKTRLRLTHSGLDSFAQSGPDFARDSFAAGWTELIGTLLKQFVEGNKI